jgi:predicted RND superfamily exporter protein
VIGILAVAAVTVGGLLQLRFDTSVASLFPKGDQTSLDYDAAQKSFGSEPITVLLQQPGKARQMVSTKQIPALLRLEGELSKLRDVEVVYGPATVLNQIAGSAQNLLATISGTRDGLRTRAHDRAKAAGASEAAATAAGEQAIVPFDERYGVLLTKASPSGLPTLRNQAFVDAAAYAKDGSPRPELRFVLPTPTSAAILVRPRANLDQASEGRLEAAVRRVVARDQVGTAKATVTGPSVVLHALAVEVQHQIPYLGALAVLLVGAVLLFGHRAELRSPSRVARLLMPVLCSLGAAAILAAALGWAHQPASLGLLTLLPVLLGVGTDVPVYLSRLGRSRRLLVAALATATGFLTTAYSPVPFVKSLGILLALGVIMATAVAWFLPSAGKASAADVDPVRGAATHSPGPRSANNLRALRGAVALMAVVAAVGWILLPRIPVTADPETLAGGLPALSEAQQSQKTIGATGEIDVLLRGDVLSPAALAWSARASNAVLVSHADDLKPILAPTSLLGFLGPRPTEAQVKSAVSILPSYLLGAALHPESKSAVLSFGLRHGDIASQQALIKDLRQVLPPAPRGTSVAVTGVPVLASHQLTVLKESRLSANIIGVLAPSLVLLMLLGWRRRRDSLLALTSAALATGTGFLLMALLGVPFTPLTLALGSLTAAVGCEFTVVLAASTSAASRRAVALAAGACLVGYLSLMASKIDVVRNFGMVLAASVVLGYLSARLVCALWQQDAKSSQADPNPAHDRVPPAQDEDREATTALDLKGVGV